MDLTYALISKAGDRDLNEDSLAVCDHAGHQCFVLCDGLGGHGMGDVASSLVVDVFKAQFDQADDLTDFIGQTLLAAQDILLAEQIARRASKRMKTTAAALVLDEKNAYIGHVGDSRVYAFFKNKVKTRTLDHSIPQMLALAGDIKEAQIRQHPDRNALLRVLGVDWEQPMYDLLQPIVQKKCQAFLLCSDGFWEHIEDKQMCYLLKKTKSVHEWLEEMTQLVEQNGAGLDMDNYSAIAVWL